MLAQVVTKEVYQDIRQAAAHKLTNQTVLAAVAMGDEAGNIRKVAVSKLADQAVLAKVALEDNDKDVREAAVSKLTDQAVLTKVALEEEDRDVRRTAVGKLADQAVLARVVAEDKDWDVRKLAFGELSDAGLAKLAAETNDRAVQLAAAVKQGRKTWRAVFSETPLRGSDLRDAMNAIRLAGDERFVDDAIVHTCHRFIRQGNEAHTAALREALTLYGNRFLAEDYMNCGQPYLRAVGETWAHAHGYQTTPGLGSRRVRWGSAR